MPRNKVTEVFKYEELDDRAKEKAREWYTRDYPDHDWWDSCYEVFTEVCEIIGVELDTESVRLMGGGTRKEPQIQFSGFWSQGDGASFTGRYEYCCTAVDKIREYAPKDTELHSIVDALEGLGKAYPSPVWVRITHRGRYSHSGCMSFDGGVMETVDSEGEWFEPELTNLDEFADQLRNLADWMYSRLEKEYEWLTSDEVVEENIIANAYEFDCYGNPE